MRHLTQLTLLIIAFFGCNTINEKSKSKINHNQKLSQAHGKQFFDYDEIDYFFNDYGEEQIGHLYDNQSKSELDSLRMGVVLGNIPKNIPDLSFIKQLDQIGYKERRVDKSKFASINKLFVEKAAEENVVTACIYVYRDILIFKKNKKIIGTAKVCFGCMAHEITGTNANTENFGKDGDYEKLGDLLRN